MISKSLNQINEVFQKSDQMKTKGSSEQISLSLNNVSALEHEKETTLNSRKPTPRNAANGFLNEVVIKSTRLPPGPPSHNS